MKLANLIHNKKESSETILTVTNITTGEPINDEVNSVGIEEIRSWLYRIGEPPEDHDLVLDKCKNDHDAMNYFLKHSRGEFNGG